MSWRDILRAQSNPIPDPQYPHNSQKSVAEQVSGDCGDIGEQKSVTATRERAHKAKTWDESGPAGEYAAEDERLSELLARKPIVRVQSRLLGEVVVWVADGVEIPAGTAEVAYTESELRGLVEAGRRKSFAQSTKPSAPLMES